MTKCKPQPRLLAHGCALTLPPVAKYNAKPIPMRSSLVRVRSALISFFITPYEAAQK